MGKIKKGILGGFSGTVGTVVGGNWNGIDYMRSLPTVKNKEATPTQIIQRAKFALASGFLRSIESLIDVTFREKLRGVTKRNRALSQVLKECIVGEFPDLSINYKLIVLARGGLLNVTQPKAIGADASISFSWTPNHGTGNARTNDKAVLIAFHAPSGTLTYIVGSATRAQGAAILATPAQVGEELHTWIAFMSENGKEVSNSIYTGSVNVV